jgi:hypothetical protein
MSITEHPRSMSDASMPDEPTPPGRPFFAVQIEAARTAQQLSIDDVCRRTNIRPAVVSALECGDIGPSGSPVYARGHVRSLAHALDLDPTPLVASFDQEYGADASLAPVLISDTDAAEVSLRPSRPPTSGPRWPIVMAVVLVAVIVAALVQLLLPSGDKSGQRAVAAPPSASASAPAQHEPKPKPTTPPLAFPVPAEGVTLRIVLLSKPSWLDVTDERGVNLIQTTVQPSNKALDLHAAGRLHATIGDASAAAVSCNGHPLGPLGAPAEVVTLDLTRGSPQCPGA